MKINNIHSSWYLWAGAHLSLIEAKKQMRLKKTKERKVEAAKETSKDKNEKYKKRFTFSKIV